MLIFSLLTAIHALRAQKAPQMYEIFIISPHPTPLKYINDVFYQTTFPSNVKQHEQQETTKTTFFFCSYRKNLVTLQEE